MNVNHYIGFDVHKKSVSFCVKGADGRIFEEGKLRATHQVLRQWAQERKEAWHGAMEATLFSGWIYDTLGCPRNLWVTSTGIAAEICIRIGATARSLGCEHKTLEAHHRTVNRPFGVTWRERSERRRHPQMNRRQPPKKPQNATKKTDYKNEHRAGELPQSLKARLPAVWRRFGRHFSLKATHRFPGRGEKKEISFAVVSMRRIWPNLSYILIEAMPLRHSRELTILCSPKVTHHHRDVVSLRRAARACSCPAANEGIHRDPFRRAQAIRSRAL
jgi:hypothetical protein